MSCEYRRVVMWGMLGLCSIGMIGATYATWASEDDPLWTRLDESAIRGGEDVCKQLVTPKTVCPVYGTQNCLANGDCSTDPAPKCLTDGFDRKVLTDYHPGVTSNLETGFYNSGTNQGYCLKVEKCDKGNTCGHDGDDWYCKTKSTTNYDPVSAHWVSVDCP